LYFNNNAANNCYIRSAYLTCDFGGSTITNTNYNWTDYNWHHVVVTKEGSSVKVYVDDTNTYSGSYTYTIGDYNMYFGTWNYHSFRDGKIDEIGLWSRALTSDEVTELYNSGAGFTYPFTSNINLDFNYSFYQNKMILEAPSQVDGNTITNWQWDINDITESTNQDYNHIVTEYNDYNVCLYVTYHDSNGIIDDFETGTISTDTWDDSCTDCMTIEDTIVYQGDYSAKLSTWYDGVMDFMWYGGFSQTQYSVLPETQSKDTNYKTWFYVPSTNGGYLSATINAYAGEIVAGVEADASGLFAYDGESGTYFSTSYTTNAWHLIEFVINNDNTTYDAYLYNSSGTLISSLIDLDKPYDLDTNYLALFSYVKDGVAEETVYYDYVNYVASESANDCQLINSGKIYGDAIFHFYDENSELLLNDVTYTISPSINGDSEATLTDTNTFDLNLQGIANTEYTFTFTKTDYGTRYYVTDLNQYSDLNISFALLPSSLSETIPLKVYKTDETTIFVNTYVELYLPEKNNWIVGKRKTNSSGETSFSLSQADQNYYANVNNGEFIYQPVALTVLYPKNEETLLQITEDWKIDITQNLFVSYSDLNADKIIYLLPNTANPYNIKISDMNGNYFPRTYAQQYPGNPLSATLQPYLVSTTTGLLTTLTTKNAYTNTVIGSITVKIYKNISGEGRTLVETVITDDKGQALILLVLNGEYEFEAYQDATFLKTYTITATSSTIWLLLPIGNENIPTKPISGIKTSFTPTSTGLAKTLVGTQAFTQTLTNFGALTYTYTSIITQDGVVLSTQSGSSSDTSKTFSHTINWVDLDSGVATSKITIIVSGNTYIFSQDYYVNDAFGTNVNLLEVLSTGLRSDATCEATGVCFPLLVIGLIACIAIAVMASLMMGNLSGQSAGILFLIPMVLFTYLTWIPFELTVGVVIILLAFLINERRT